MATNKHLSALLWVLLLLLVPPAFELTVRLEDWARFGVPLDSPVTTIDDLSVVDSVGQHARPGTAFKQFRINALGFRGAELPDSILRSRPLVITSGASETFGAYESPDHEWPRQMADSLASRCGSDRVTVLNAAFAGMALPTVIQDVQLRLLPLHPRIIVYYPTPSQYLYMRSPVPSPRSTQPPKAFSRWRSRALPRLRDALKSAVPAPVLEYLRRGDTERARESGEELFPSLPVERLDSIDGHLRVLIGTVRRGGSALVLMIPQNRFADTTSIEERRWLRAWEHMMPKASASMLLSFGELARVRVRAVAADSGVTLVDPALMVRPERASLFADYLHFTDRGAAIVAGAVASSVAPMLGCTSRPSAVARLKAPPSRP
jgi:hypothetical protein